MAKHTGVAQRIRATVFETAGCRFESYHRYLAGELLCVAEVSDAGNVIASMEYMLIVDLVYIMNLEVETRYQRMGIGRHLIDSVQGHLCLEVHEDNEGAIAFYLDRGLRVLGRMPRYYDDGDAIYMERQADR